MRTPEAPFAYGQDLAWVHDVGHGDFARGSAPGILKILSDQGAEANGRPGRVIDLGCGSGILAAELNRAGYQVLGVDISPAMISLARERAPGSTFVVASLFSFELPECDAVTSIGECMSYAFDPASGEAGLAQLLARIHAALRPGGVLVFDLLEPGHVEAGTVDTRVTDTGEWTLIREATEDVVARTLTREITVFRRIGAGGGPALYRRSDERHMVHLYDADTVAALTTLAGFAEVHRLDRYGDQEFRPGHVGFLAIKDSRP
jgi:SAM-dependent methyltransferase